jgi:hypothetical protein
MQIIQLAHQSLRGGASPPVRSQAEPGNEDLADLLGEGPGVRANRLKFFSKFSVLPGGGTRSFFVPHFSFFSLFCE